MMEWPRAVLTAACLQQMVTGALLLVALRTTSGAEDPLRKGFQSPPPEARPELYWNWMQDLVSKEGITHDLEAMKRAGFSGALIMLIGHADSHFNPDHNMPHPVKCMSPEFFEHWKFAAEEANRLGLTLISQCGPGWCHSGGPWIKPEHAFQSLAFSELPVTGPQANARFVLAPAKGAGQVLALPYQFTHDLAVLAIRGGKEQLTERDVIELTDRVKDGVLSWDVPAGSWIVRRLCLKNGRSFNRVAPAGGIGLECDKLSREANQAMFDGMVGRFLADSPKLAGQSILGMEADSWEVGMPEWSPGFRDEFKKRRGYDPMPWLLGWRNPKEPGPKYGTPELGARFQYDLTLTRADVFADNFFSYLTGICAQKGLLFMTEPYYGPFDPVRCGGRTARPMGEFWSQGDLMQTLRWAASAAHTYGRKMAGAEAFTGRWNDGAWGNDPYSHKRIGDLAFCNGINKMTLHGFALQPWGDKVKPGMSTGFWGSMFTPGQTWWEPGRAWIAYIARCQFMLQQGQAVADILALFPSVDWKYSTLGGLPKCYNYDLCSDEILMQAEFRDGRFILPHADAGYRLLLLPPMKAGADPVLLRKVLDLVKAGGTVIYPDKVARPERALGLGNYPACDKEVQQLAAELWGACDGKTITENRCGKGRLVCISSGNEENDPETYWLLKHPAYPQFYYHGGRTLRWSEPLRKLMAGLGAPPDVEVQCAGGPGQVFCGQETTGCSPRKDEDAVAWIHRREGEREIYFLASQVAVPVTAEVTFRVAGKIPEFWDPMTGQVIAAAVWHEENGRTVVPIPFSPFGSLFVVFSPGRSDAIQSLTCDGQACPAELAWRQGDHFGLQVNRPGNYTVKLASGRTATAEIDSLPAPLAFSGPWQVTFPAGWGAPAEASMELGSWTANADPGIRYFSGTAAYERDFDLPAERLGPGLRHHLDLGKIKNLAEVIVNGRSVGILWKPPFRLDVTAFLKPGSNHLTVKVTNLWVNRMVGDEQQPDDCSWVNVNKSPALRPLVS